jgi:hypothetical protein
VPHADLVHVVTLQPCAACARTAVTFCPAEAAHILREQGA